MDETSIYLDFPSAYAYEKIGTRRVKASTAGSERTRISAAFTAFADGTKSKIYLILPRATPMPDYKPPFNVVVKYATNGSFNEDIICDYLTEIMIDQPVGTTLILDSAKCHLTSKVNDKIREFGLNKFYLLSKIFLFLFKSF